ncbi:MAG: hypothetical protein L6Q59_10300 [Ignavibacteriaceae bacterium]|nr:hypothetical protein [Ignavibacteriaceae bacterium]
MMKYSQRYMAGFSALDSTVTERFGKQERSKSPSHHPLIAYNIMATLYFALL